MSQLTDLADLGLPGLACFGVMEGTAVGLEDLIILKDKSVCGWGEGEGGGRERGCEWEPKKILPVKYTHTTFQPISPCPSLVPRRSLHPPPPPPPAKSTSVVLSEISHHRFYIC